MKRSTWLLLLCLPLLWGMDFLKAQAGRELVFPQDHQPHAGFKTEWWYYTGQLAQGEQNFGFQFTLFKVERRQKGQEGVFFLLHCALSDAQTQAFSFGEDLQRQFPGLAGLKGQELRLKNNRLLIQGQRHQITTHCQDWSLELDLSHRLPPVLHGQRGYSPKGEDFSNASHYYSVVDLTGKARLSYQGKTLELKAQVWMDHEWGSSFLKDYQKGWDWANFSLDQGQRLMVFRIRQEGRPDFLAGSLIDPQGQATPLDAQSLSLESQGLWTSPTSQAQYPARIKVKLAQGELLLEPWFAGQELNTPLAGMAYWEGAVRVKGNWNHQPTQGWGYLEMTGYAPGLKDQL